MVHEEPLIALEELCTVINDEPVAFSEDLLLRIRSLAEHFESQRCIDCLDDVSPNDASRPWMNQAQDVAPAADWEPSAERIRANADFAEIGVTLEGLLGGCTDHHPAHSIRSNDCSGHSLTDCYRGSESG